MWCAVGTLTCRRGESRFDDDQCRFRTETELHLLRFPNPRSFVRFWDASTIVHGS